METQQSGSSREVAFVGARAIWKMMSKGGKISHLELRRNSAEKKLSTVPENGKMTGTSGRLTLALLHTTPKQARRLPQFHALAL